MLKDITHSPGEAQILKHKQNRGDIVSSSVPVGVVCVHTVYVYIFLFYSVQYSLFIQRQVTSARINLFFLRPNPLSHPFNNRPDIHHIPAQ